VAWCALFLPACEQSQRSTSGPVPQRGYLWQGRGKGAMIVPEPNAREAAMVAGIEIYAVQNLRQTFQFVRGETTLQPGRGDLSEFFATQQNYEVAFADVKGQGHVKRTVEVAVAGEHNILRF
jgi:magnesium chelatase family protein